MDIEQTAITIRDAIKDTPKRYSDNQDRITRIERELCDIRHLIELGKANLYEAWQIYKMQQDLYIERRKLKDENEQLKHLQPIMKNMKDKAPKLDNSIGEIRKVKNNMDNRLYRCRVRKDLEKKINSGVS
jgi:predicted  nucleic acid-binding Zn-ribbon protein